MAHSELEMTKRTCVLCCHESSAWAVGECDHPTCLHCSAKLRVLCDQRDCPVCRLKLDLVFVVAEVRLFSTFPLFRLHGDRKYRIFFESAQLHRLYDLLKQNSCSKCVPNSSYRTFKQLRDHVNKEHDLHYCDICVDNLKLFPSEFKMYTRHELARHRREGDSDDSSYKGHPLCRFCDERYLDNDALHTHLRIAHFWCHICESDGKQDYYKNYLLLRRHFKEAHYLCEEGECRHEKFTTVFRSKIDLQAHRASTHTKGLSKAEVKQLKQLELGFSYVSGREEGGARATRSRAERGPMFLNSRSGMTAQMKERENFDVATAVSVSTQHNDTKNRPKRRSPTFKKKADSPDEPKAPPGFAGVQPNTSNILKRSGGTIVVDTNAFNPYAGVDTDINPGHQNPEPTGPPGFETISDTQKEANIASPWPDLVGDRNSAKTASPQEVPSTCSSELIGFQQPSFTYGGPMTAWSQARESLESKQEPPVLATAVQCSNEQDVPVRNLLSDEGSQYHPQEPKPSWSKKDIRVLSLESFPPIPGSTVTSNKTPRVDETPSVQGSSDSPTSRKAMESKVVEKVRNVLGRDKSKFTQFKTLSGWYRSGAITVHEYSTQCSALLGSNWKEIGPQVAAVFPEQSKKDELDHLFGQCPPSAQPVKRAKSKKKSKVTTVWNSRMPTTSRGSSSKPPPARSVLSESDYPSLEVASGFQGSKVTSGQGQWNMIVRS